MKSLKNLKLPEVDGDVDLNPEDAMTLREDKAVTDKFRREELLANAPEVQAGCLVVPKTVE